MHNVYDYVTFTIGVLDDNNVDHKILLAQLVYLVANTEIFIRES